VFVGSDEVGKLVGIELVGMKDGVPLGMLVGTEDGSELVGYTPWFYSSNRRGSGGSYMTQFTVVLKGQKYSEGLFRRDMPQGACKGEEPQGGRVHLYLGSSDAYTQLYADNCKWKLGSCGYWRSQSASSHCEASETNLEVPCA